VVLFVLLSLVSLSLGQPPIPKTYDGFKIGSPTAPVLLEAFFDLVCPDSATSWPVIKQVLSHYGPDKILFIIHLYSLPYHRNAYLSTRGSYVIKGFDPSLVAFWKWVDLIFDEQGQFYDVPTRSKSTLEVVDDMGQLATQVGIPIATWTYGMLSDSSFDSAGRVAWKYGAARGTYGTPMFLINGVWVNADQRTGYNAWLNILDPLFTFTKEGLNQTMLH